MWPLDEWSAGLAKWLTAIVVAAAAGWKIWLRVRRDNRQDHGGAAAEDGYETIIAQLSSHVQRLDKLVADMGERLNREMQARYQCEAVNEGLRIRIAALETEIRALKALRAGDMP